MGERVVFVPGAGGSGSAAWPAQHGLALTYDCLFYKGGSGGWADTARDVTELLDDGGHLVAHSEGAVSAMMAAVESPVLVHSLTLMEPACLSLTRGLPATETHIRTHREASVRPWDAPLDIVPGVTMLVLTGGWEPVYEEVADYLAATGARHRQVGGEHRPQDTARGRRMLSDFLAAHRTSG